jgi:imidazolonepropionase-like amidohydrolase
MIIRLLEIPTRAASQHRVGSISRWGVGPGFCERTVASAKTANPRMEGERSTMGSAIRFAICIGMLAWSAASNHRCFADDLMEINPPSNVSDDRVLALVGATLIDGNGGEPLKNATIVVRGSRIDTVGPSGSVNLPQNAEIVELSGMTVVPGFVDCHFHSINDLDPPQAFLANGVTTFRDPGHPFRFYQAARQTSKPMPRVFLTGAHLDAYPPIWPQQAVIVGNKQQTQEAVQDHIERGATAIKVYFRLPLELIQTACEAAHQLNVPVTAHLELVRATDAIGAGIDGVEHVTSFGTSLASETAAARFVSIVEATPAARKEWRYRLWAGLDFNNSRKLDAVLRQIVDNKIVISPTLAVFERHADDVGIEDFEVLGFQNMLEFIRRCHRAGATIVAGSHTWVPRARFGLAFHRELELLVQCGLSPMEAISAGTRNGARFLGSEKRLGTVEQGKLADLVVVEGNPADDITHLRAVRRVMLHGRWIAREDLSPRND